MEPTLRAASSPKDLEEISWFHWPFAGKIWRKTRCEAVSEYRHGTHVWWELGRRRAKAYVSGPQTWKWSHRWAQLAFARRDIPKSRMCRLLQEGSVIARGSGKKLARLCLSIIITMIPCSTQTFETSITRSTMQCNMSTGKSLISCCHLRNILWDLDVKPYEHWRPLSDHPLFSWEPWIMHLLILISHTYMKSWRSSTRVAAHNLEPHYDLRRTRSTYPWASAVWDELSAFLQLYL